MSLGPSRREGFGGGLRGLILANPRPSGSESVPKLFHSDCHGDLLVVQLMS